MDEVATAPAEPVEVCDPEEVFELPEAAPPVPEADSEAPAAEDSLAADVTVDEGAPVEDEAEPDSTVTDG